MGRVRTPTQVLGAWRTASARLLKPATWFHVARLLNAQGYGHVEQVRVLSAGRGLAMAPSVSLRNAARITLGTEVHVGERCTLWAGEVHGRIVLGDNALLGPEVFITTSTYGLEWGTGVPVMHQPKRELDVVVGDDVWLGAKVVVLPGVRIGDGAVVGAGAVVTKDLPPGCIAAGTPARVIAWRPGMPAEMRSPVVR